MSLVRFNPSALPVFANLVDNFLGRDMFDMTNQSFGGTLPAVNIRENGQEFIVEVAAPGMKKDDFKVVLENTLLTISSEKQENHESSQETNYTRREFSYAAFSRSFTMPNTVDADKIRATYHNGVLQISIPKREEAKQKPPRTIDIA